MDFRGTSSHFVDIDISRIHRILPVWCAPTPSLWRTSAQALQASGHPLLSRTACIPGKRKRTNHDLLQCTWYFISWSLSKGNEFITVYFQMLCLQQKVHHEPSKCLGHTDTLICKKLVLQPSFRAVGQTHVQWQTFEKPENKPTNARQ